MDGVESLSVTRKPPKPQPRLEPPRLLRALADGKTVEVLNQGWRKGCFDWLPTKEEPLRIFVEAVKGDKAWIRLNEEPPERWLHKDASKGYSGWREMALGARTASPVRKDGSREEIEPKAVPLDVQDDQTKASNENWEHYREVVRPEEVAKEKSRRLVNKLRKLEREATKSGVDLSSTLEDAVRQSRSQILAKRDRAA